MVYDLRVALLLWAPLGLVFLSVGLQFRKDTAVQRVGKVLGTAGLVLFSVSFLTVPSSPSAASSALFVSILPSLILMIFGLYMALFSGEIPVRRFAPIMRPIGLLLFVLGFALFESMHWSDFSIMPSTTWDGETNRFWMVYRPTFLLAMSSFLLTGGYLVHLVQKRTTQSSLVLYATGLCSFMLLMASVFFDGSSTTAEEFHTSVLLAASDVLGFVAGIGLSILAFGLTIWQFERKRPQLNQLPPPNQEQLAKAAEIVQHNIGGDDDE